MSSVLGTSNSNDAIVTYYRDMLMKASFYRERIVKDLAKNGQILTDKAIQDRLSKIELYLPIFQREHVKRNTHFDADKFTYDLHEIYEDLRILYELLYDFTVKEYEEVSNYLEAHLREMESEANHYIARINMELNSTSLGDTLFYKDGPYPWYTKDNYVYADLGDALLKEGSLIGLLVSGENVTHDNIAVGIIRGNETSYIAPYNHNHDIYEVPGASVRNRYETTYDETVNLSDTFELTIPDFKPDENSSYVAYNGKGKILVTENDRREHLTQEDHYSYYVKNDWKVSFYIKDGTYAHFEFSKELKNKNFEGVEINDLKPVHKIEMRDKEAFGFSVYTDGVLYAEQKACRLTNGSLHYPLGALSSDFLIEEKMPGKDVEVKLFLRVRSDGEKYPEIESMSLKELLETDVTRDDSL